jgi:Fe-S cluster assembly protein SufD
VSAHFAIDLRDAETFPTRRVEDWKWTDLRRWLREAPEPSPAIEVARHTGPFAAFGGSELIFANGRAFDGKPALEFPVIVDQVVQLRFVTDANHTGHQGECDLHVLENKSLLLLESYEGRGEGYVANTSLGIRLDPGASVTRIVWLADAADAISISRADIQLSAGARFEQTVLASGAKIQRHETHVAHPGEGASVRLDGVYVNGGERHADLTTVVEHTGVGGETVQLTKGVVAGRARGVFQGRIIVNHGADKTDARMGHHALILSDRAEVDAKPELEIYADDVACAHGNTIGAIDENALFYAMSRGLPEPDARALLTQAFLGEVVDRIEREDVRDVARAWLADQLEGLA